MLSKLTYCCVNVFPFLTEAFVPHFIKKCCWAEFLPYNFVDNSMYFFDGTVFISKTKLVVWDYESLVYYHLEFFHINSSKNLGIIGSSDLYDFISLWSLPHFSNIISVTFQKAGIWFALNPTLKKITQSNKIPFRGRCLEFPLHRSLQLFRNFNCC